MTSSDQLVAENFSLVAKIVNGMSRKLPLHVDRGDLHSAGLEGLFKAAKSYKDDSPAKFSTYATYRVRGEIIEELRRMDNGSRQMRQIQRQLEKVQSELSKDLDRVATTVELAKAMGMSDKRLAKHEMAYHRAVVSSLDKTVSEDTTSMLNKISDNTLTPDEVMNQASETEMFKNVISKLTEREQQVILLHYYEDLNLREISEVLGISESRVSQIRSEAHSKLKNRLSPKMLAH